MKRFRGEVLTDNEPVRQLLDEVGAVVRPAEGGSLVFDVELAPAEEHRLEAIARKVLRAAASHLVGLIPGLGPRAQ